MVLHFSWVLTDGEGQSFSGEFNKTLDEKSITDLQKALTDAGHNSSVYINFQTPNYFEMKEGKTTPVIFEEANITDPFGYGNLTLSLNWKEHKMWWDVSENCDTEASKLKRNALPHRECGRAVLHVFSPKRVPGIYKYFTTQGIIGIYASFVLLCWTFIRRSMATLHLEVKYNYLPNVDYLILQLNNIQLARESEEFALEEDLYSKMLFLFRSPETIIRFTRLTQEDFMAARRYY